MYKQVVCFLRRKDEILMLNRDYAPVQGLWNGVGGKKRENELPLDCAIREVEEETGIVLSANEIAFKGIVTWNSDKEVHGGLYVYLAEMPNDFTYETPRKTSEGILDWKKISWLLNSDNLGTGEMIPHYLPNLLDHSKPLKHICTIRQRKLTDYEYTCLDEHE